MNSMIVYRFVYLIPAFAFFTWIFEIFLIAELVTIRVAKLNIMQNCYNLVHIIYLGMYMKLSTVFFIFELKTLRGAHVL